MHANKLIDIPFCKRYYLLPLLFYHRQFAKTTYGKYATQIEKLQFAR